MHVGLALRAAALDSMPLLWEALSDDFSVALCALRYQARRIVALLPVGTLGGHPDATVGLLLEGWHDGVAARVGPVSAGRSATHVGESAVRIALEEAERR